ncbi:MAG: DUF799 domain-containing protein [Campylobacter sp.]|nr:DUF799 domain-containing protein [Campylobacter sp.]
MRSKVLLIILSIFILSGCAQKKSEPYDYSAFLQSKPRSILVVMPTNESLEPKGASAMLTNATFPLSEAGYYVFPVALVNDTFKNNGFYEANDIAKIPLNKLREVFGADSVLYINIKQYGTNYAVIASSTVVSAEAKLVDTISGKTLWDGSVTLSDQANNNGGGIIGMLITAAISQIADTIGDKGYDVSINASNVLFATGCDRCILKGPYRKDSDNKFSN